MSNLIKILEEDLKNENFNQGFHKMLGDVR